jgi:SAM-dependent methyltransferase
MRTALTSRHFQLHQNILRELGHALTPGARVLDYGCGKGSMVEEYCAAGFDAFGCDISLENETERLRRIEPNGLISYADATFDFVFSDQVMEHVQDHEKAFGEIARVMKPNGVSLHIFPSKLKPIENHVFVPLGGVIQNRGWLRLWAHLGIRNSFQKGKSAGEVVELNSQYLQQRTNYLSRRNLMKVVNRYFTEVTDAEKFLIKHSYGHAQHIYPSLRLFPFLARMYATFYSRAIFLRKV